MRPEEKVKLLDDLFDVVFHGFESFRVDNVGADLAYLMGAIVSGDNVDWTARSYGASPSSLLPILRRAFPDDHVLWRYIALDPEKGG